MTSIIWILIWLITMLIPLSKTQLKGWGHYLFSFIFGIITALIIIGGGTSEAYLIWFLIGFKIIWQLIESGIMLMLKDDLNISDLEEGFHAIVVLIGIIALIVIIIAGGWWNYGMIRGVRSATYFDQLIQPAEGLPFNQTIQSNMLRLTTPELARSIALRHMAQLGSNLQILSTHVTKYNGRLVWVSTIASTNLWSDNRIRHLVIVDANDPEKEPEIIRDINFNVGEGLLTIYPFVLGDAGARLYHGYDTAMGYGRAYMTPNKEGQWKLVVTSVYPRMDNQVQELRGVFVFNQMGNLETYYEQGKIPSWISQIYDEGWLEGMIGDWGGFKRADHDFDVWAGGFLWMTTPSNNRVEMSEDTRFIVDPDTQEVIALVLVHPVGNDKALAGLFKATPTGIKYYDFRSLNVYSGEVVMDIAESQLNEPTRGEFVAQMPLLYNVKDNLAWFVPIYYRELGVDEKVSDDDTLQLQYLALVDADDLNHVTIEKKTSTSPTMVDAVIQKFLSGQEPEPEPQPTTEKEINGTITYISSVYGDSYHTITVNGTDIYFKVDATNVKYFDSLAINQTVSWIVDTNYTFLRIKS